MIKPVAIDHIVLRTENLETMIDFYSQVLGCHIDNERSSGLGLTQLRAGHALIDLVDVNSEMGRQGGGPPRQWDNAVDHFCLQIEPVDEADLLNYLAEAAVESGEFSQRYGAQGYGRSIYIKDPDGNTVELRNHIP